MDARFYTPPQVAKLLRVKPSKVVAWITSGELTASNVALKRTGRRQLFHTWRRTVATYFKRAGGDATLLLGHSTPEVTEVYLNAEVIGSPQPATILFRPNAKDDKTTSGVPRC